MKFSSPLDRGCLIKRYKRFLADVRLADGRVLTIHCPNTGSMKHCATPGDQVWFSTSDSKTRKYPHTWELVRTRRGHYIGINTLRANGLVAEGVAEGRIPELSGYTSIRSEVRYGRENSRIDLLLAAGDSRPDCFVEVKSVTLLEEPVSKGMGYFPDAVSARGTKHLRELIEVVRSGSRAVLCFCVQHSGIQQVSSAEHIDPDYGQALASAMAAGVEVIAYKVRLSPASLRLSRRLPFVPAP